MGTHYAFLNNLESAEIAVSSHYHNGKNEKRVAYVLARDGKEQFLCFENRETVKSLAINAAEAAKKVGDATVRAILSKSSDAEQRLSISRAKAEEAREKWLLAAQEAASVDIKIRKNAERFTFLALYDPFPMTIVIGNARAIGAIFSTNDGTAGCTVSVVHPWYAPTTETKPTPAPATDVHAMPGIVVASADKPKEGNDSNDHNSGDIDDLPNVEKIDLAAEPEESGNGHKDELPENELPLEVREFDAKLQKCDMPVTQCPAAS